MRIPILLSVASQEPLVESASALQERRIPTRRLEDAYIPSPVELDPRFAAVPIGRGTGFVSAVEQQPGRSERFIVRGTVEADSIEDVPIEIEGRALYADPAIEPLQHPTITCGGAPFGNTVDVQTNLRTAALASKGLDGTDVAIAIVDTGMNTAHLNTKLGVGVRIDAANSWSPPGSTTLAGKWPVSHGTMCAYDALIVAPKATLLDYPVLSSRAPGGATMSGSLSVAMQAYSFLIASWAVAFAPGGLSKYTALVVSNSWGMYHPSWDFPPGHPGRYCDNPAHPFHLLMSALVASGADVVFAAGNCGADCPDGRCLGRTAGTIMGSNAHADVLTVAGCDTSGARVGYSSQGPSIPGMPPQKPDITGYTHFLGSEAYGPGSADGGTSAACPVVAGCIAALRSKLPHATTPPKNLYTQLMADATTPPGKAVGWNGDYGHGVVDPVAAATSLGLYP